MALPSHGLHPRAARSLLWRIRLFGVGGVLGLGGIFLEMSWLVTSAVVVLMAGLGIRFLPGMGPVDEEDDEPED